MRSICSQVSANPSHRPHEHVAVQAPLAMGRECIPSQAAAWDDSLHQGP
jgi:hypothetical protein